MGRDDCAGGGPPKRTPWVFDNGAFKDWRHGLPFQTARYEKAIDKLATSSERPEWVAVPDIVAGGMESLRFSLSWAKRLAWLGLPLYLVVQDGMSEAQVADELAPFSGIFVGGSLRWKLETGWKWTDFAHSHGRRCHIGRMGTRERVRAARRWGVDSIDSCLPLWSKENLGRFLAGFKDPLTHDMFEGVA